MSATYQSTFGIYQGKLDVEKAVRGLIQTGIKKSDISVLFPRTASGRQVTYTQPNHIAQGAIIGGAIGLALGFILSLLFVSGAIDFSVANQQLNLSPYFIVAIVSLGFATVGAAAGAMVGIGTPDTAAQRYREYLKTGSTVLSVHRETRVDPKIAEKILFQTGAQEVHTMNENRTWSVVMAQDQSDKKEKYPEENLPPERGVSP